MHQNSFVQSFLIHFDAFFSSSTLSFDFDTKILFLILCCDPQLVHFHRFVRTTVVSHDEIKGLKFEEEIEKAKMARRSQFQKLEEDIRYQIDFYDPNLINLEFIYFSSWISR